MFNVRINPRVLLKVASSALAVVWLSGCASAQPVPSSPELILSALAPNDEQIADAAGSVVRWGGTIASVQNTEDGKSVLEIVSRPLHNGGRPVHNDQSEGRFIAETAEFLDPEIVSVGRDMTLVGTVSGVREGKVGEAAYVFPVVTIDTYRYWKPQTALRARQNPHWYGYSPYPHDSFFRPHSRFRHSSRYRAGFSGSIGFRLH